MAAVLAHHTYGKSRVCLTRVTRQADRHDLKELTIDIRLEGDFAGSYTHGDNSHIIATDSMKNTVHVLAREQPLPDLESFGLALADFFLAHYAHVSLASVRLAEQPWRRITVAGQEYPHAFMGGGTEQRTCMVSVTRQERRIEAGLEDLLILKTTDSAFRGFIRDRYTTLADTDDRIFATILTAAWQYRDTTADWNRCYDLIHQTLLETFARHQSLSVQQTLYDMGAAALGACDAVEEITLTMPNQHRLLVNLQPFGLDNPNEVFVPTHEPFGLISGTLRRDSRGKA
jgi:urate oxidase